MTWQGNTLPPPNKYLFHSPTFFCWFVCNSFLVVSCFLVARLREVLVINSTFLTFAEGQKWLSKNSPITARLGCGQKLSLTQSSFLLELSLGTTTFSLCVQSLLFCYFHYFFQVEIWIPIILVWVLRPRGSLKIKCWCFDDSARVATSQMIYFPRELWNVAAVKCIEMFFKVKATKVLLFLQTKCFCSGRDATVLPKYLDWVWDISLIFTVYRQRSFSLSFVSKTTVIYCLSQGESLLAGCSSNSQSWWYW